METRQRTGPVKVLTGTLGALDRGIARVEAWILAYGVILMAVNSIANVFGRAVVGQSLYFSEELNQFLIVLVTFVGLGYATRRGRHIRMSALYDQFGETGRKALMVFICAVTALVMFVLAFYAYRYVASVAASGRVTAALRVPLYLTYVWVPLGFLITGIQYALAVVRNLTEREIYLSYETIDSYEEAEAVSPTTKAEPYAGSPGTSRRA